MCFAFKKNNKRTKKPVNHFLQDGASAGMQSLQTSILIKLCQTPWNYVDSGRRETGSSLGRVGTISTINHGDNVNITGRTKMSKDFGYCCVKK